jgi:hypothetical protein
MNLKPRRRRHIPTILSRRTAPRSLSLGLWTRSVSPRTELHSVRVRDRLVTSVRRGGVVARTKRMEFRLQPAKYPTWQIPHAFFRRRPLTARLCHQAMARQSESMHGGGYFFRSLKNSLVSERGRVTEIVSPFDSRVSITARRERQARRAGIFIVPGTLADQAPAGRHGSLAAACTRS